MTKTEKPKMLSIHKNIHEVMFSSHVVGTTFVNRAGELLMYLKENVPMSQIRLHLIPEPENPYDAHAVRVELSVRNAQGRGKIGYVPKDIAPSLFYVLTNPKEYVLGVGNIRLIGGEGEKGNIGVFFDYRIKERGE